MSWEPNATQRKIVFACVVVVLAGVGVYLTTPDLFGGSTRGGSAPEQTRVTGGAHPADEVGVAGDGGRAGSEETGAASPSPPPSASPRSGAGRGRPLDLLPLSEDEIGQAAAVARTFVHRFTTYRYDQDMRAYTEGLARLATDPIAEDLRKRSGALAGRQRMREREVVATSDVSMDKIRLLSAGSVVFVVTARQRIDSTEGTETQTKKYAVTLVREGADWKVSTMTLASLGDEGATGQ